MFNDAAVENYIIVLLLLCSEGIHMNTLKTKLVECGKPGLSGATVRIKLEAKIRDGGKSFYAVFKISFKQCCGSGPPGSSLHHQAKNVRITLVSSVF